MKRTGRKRSQQNDSNRLMLHRETLHKLTDDALSRVAAGDQGTLTLTQVGCDPHARIEIIAVG